MNANDLRIGNWLTCYGENVKVTQIRKDTVHYEYLSKMGNIISTGEDVENFTPILLTDELSLRCGFSNKSGWKGMEFTKTFLGDEDSRYAFQLMDDELTIFVNDVIIHINEKPTVHELQNIWKELNGQELEIKWT